jgi:tRNA (cytidine/uridine-2'-O-)-methyltransferase
MKVVLVNPLIPQNTGSIGRLCAGMDVELVLVEPLGFKLEDRYLKRAGLDYWPWINLTVAPSWQDAFKEIDSPWFFTVHTETAYTDKTYQEHDALVFGSETEGLPMELLEQYGLDRRVCIPMTNPNVRSLNLAQCTAVGLCEARRQVGFPPHRRLLTPKKVL